tara:strand:- start:46 stop:513 length:468 start_codon:yes stop_codon:yes gene_type:complete
MHQNTSSKDVLFHVLYGDDMQSVREMCHVIAQRLYSITNCKELVDSMNKVMKGQGDVAPDQLRAFFFMLLNMDVYMKEWMCKIDDEKLFAKAFIVKEEDVRKLHAYSLVGTNNMCRGKALLFFTSLRKIVQDWMSVEMLTACNFVERVKEEYLVS